MTSRVLIVAFSLWAGLLVGTLAAPHPILAMVAWWLAKLILLGAGWWLSQRSNRFADTPPDLRQSGIERPRGMGVPGAMADQTMRSGRHS